MRVLVTTPPLEKPGGVAAYFRILRPYFQETVEYLTVGARTGAESRLRVALRLFADWWRFLAALARKRYEVVHLNPSLGMKAVLRDGVLLLIAKAFRKKVIVFSHGWDHECERRLRTHFLPLFRLAYFQADCFIVLAAEFRESLRAMGYRGPVLVEGAPVEEGLLEIARQHAMAHAGEHFNILFLARIERGKGIFEAIAAYRLLKERYPFVRLTVAGEGSELERARQFAEGDGGISFLGYVTGARKRAALRDADVYLLPSHGEGLPMSVLEAMAAGLPVVTTAVGGVRDFFEDGRMGLLAESSEPETMAGLLETLLSDPERCAAIGRFNREYAQLHFSAARQAGRLEQAYERIACTR